MAYPGAPPGSVGVSHSLWWDDGGVVRRPVPNFTPGSGRRWNLAVVVANDTNMINWVRATWPEMEGRFRFIPNFVDLAQFPPGPARTEAGHFVCWCRAGWSRRRGWSPCWRRPSCLRSGRGSRFILSARAPRRRCAGCRASRRTAGSPHRSRAMAEMPAEYRDADVVVIPSVATEGTSLSCLEAMASGRPVMAGWVGGLSNLIIHEYNGLLLHPPQRT